MSETYRIRQDGRVIETGLSYQQARDYLYDMREWYEGEGYSCSWVDGVFIATPREVNTFGSTDPESNTIPGIPILYATRAKIEKE